MRPYFIWDYDLSEDKIRVILRKGDEPEKLWLIGRILTHARFEDVWQYLTLKDIAEAFPKLRLPSEVKKDWQRALNVWGYHV